MQGMAGACGILATLAHLFKLSKREEVLELAHSVLHTLKTCNSLHSSNTLLRKLSIKLAQVEMDVTSFRGSPSQVTTLIKRRA
jgi:lantibiotic modifying enzyme